MTGQRTRCVQYRRAHQHPNDEGCAAAGRSLRAMRKTVAEPEGRYGGQRCAAGRGPDKRKAEAERCDRKSDREFNARHREAHETRDGACGHGEQEGTRQPPSATLRHQHTNRDHRQHMIKPGEGVQEAHGPRARMRRGGQRCGKKGCDGEGRFHHDAGDPLERTRSFRHRAGRRKPW